MPIFNPRAYTDRLEANQRRARQAQESKIVYAAWFWDGYAALWHRVWPDDTATVKPSRRVILSERTSCDGVQGRDCPNCAGCSLNLGLDQMWQEAQEKLPGAALEDPEFLQGIDVG